MRVEVSALLLLLVLLSAGPVLLLLAGLAIFAALLLLLFLLLRWFLFHDTHSCDTGFMRRHMVNAPAPRRVQE
ncbi:hypothetical protein C725_0286 [Pacificimonas flava]|uniref:Uncharacterized protein n=1 Tax=Pacificimonas flava TaxID=1234595 RepID=M2TRG5_9SPHN|nr:hypothetical protein C725_0286 [Pacificimonas flava]